MRRLVLLSLVLAGCTREPVSEPAPEPMAKPGVAFAQPPPPAPAPAPQPAPPPRVAARVELTAVTLADDCGGASPSHGPAAHTRRKGDISSQRGAQARARCEQTSMQLAIIAGDAANVHIKSVELFDDKGASLGMLTASKPTRWSVANSVYETWDETITAGSTSNVSYVLSQPKWGQIDNRWNRTFVLKTVVSVDGIEQTAQKAVTISVTAPTALPPNVRT